MATTYNNLAHAQAAYDTLLKQKERVQRDDFINQQQAIVGVNNYLRQHGYNGGAAESILLRARGNRSDLSGYDAELANLAALISGFKSRGMGSGAAGGRSKSNYPLSTNASSLDRGRSGLRGLYGNQMYKLN